MTFFRKEGQSRNKGTFFRKEGQSRNKGTFFRKEGQSRNKKKAQAKNKMVKRTGPTNLVTKKTVAELRSLEKSKLAQYIASALEKPRRARPAVNLSKIERYAKPGETIIVPGKVLSSGNLTKNLDIAALEFSGNAKSKISKVGKILTLQEALKSKKPRIIK